MVSKKMKGGMVDSNIGYVSEDENMRKIKRIKSPLNFLKRHRSAPDDSVPLDSMRKSELKAWHKDRLKNEKYGETTSYGDVDAIEKAKKEIQRLKQEQLVRAHKRLESEAAGGLQDVYNYSVEPEGPRQPHQLPSSDLENDIMKVREKNCNNAINRTCRMNCSRLTGTQPKCSKCVEDNLSNIERKCKGYPLDDRENFPKELISKLENATPQRRDNVKLRSEKEGEKQIRNTINRAPEDRNIMKMFSRSRNRAKQKRLERKRVAALGPHGLGPESIYTTPRVAGGARRRRRTNRRKPKKSKKSKRTRRTRRR